VANNPTTPKLTVEAQDYWMPFVSGLGGRGGSNALQRNVVPIRTFGIENLFHVILPVITSPNSPGGTQTGLGGLQLYNLSTVKLHGTTYGAGPLVVLPTESGSHFGIEKWQAGIGGVAMDATKWGLPGRLFTCRILCNASLRPSGSRLVFDRQNVQHERSGLNLRFRPQ
jgi:hypothetical protein